LWRSDYATTTLKGEVPKKAYNSLFLPTKKPSKRLKNDDFEFLQTALKKISKILKFCLVFIKLISYISTTELGAKFRGFIRPTY